jgi:hypothetical protein
MGNDDDLCEDVLYTLLASAPLSGNVTRDLRDFSEELECQPHELLTALRSLDKVGSVEAWRLEGESLVVSIRTSVQESR